ncbi:DUF2460 domain-containing protein [Burkholderia ubonensis]|uniref:DUF2460 domain-containing protein n=1 Tax=Burkholderia ubonensis TaxID=101571 RepID=UPI0007572D71|nr:DUF2460 domain-containing protein [Burkholderia ubonensis]KVD63250.1 hypothetical protein WI88_09910 [Burkholderia ubonensis]
MTIASFVDERINDGLILPGTTGGPTFSTQVGEGRSGYEQRNANWTYPRAKYELGERSLTETDKELIKTFFWARQGKLQGFRFKDWTDYLVQPQQGQLQLVANTTNQYTLWKKYQTPGGSTFLRPITKPVANTLKLYDGGAQQTAFTVNTDGTVTVNWTVQSGLSWSGQFDVPVRFDTDDLKISFKAGNPDQQAMFYLYSLPLLEVR